MTPKSSQYFSADSASGITKQIDEVVMISKIGIIVGDKIIGDLAHLLFAQSILMDEYQDITST